MGHITIDGMNIPYKITFKRNKYTHIYLKKDYIQINTASNTTKQDVLKMLKEHTSKIRLHYTKIKKNKPDSSTYILFGKAYQKQSSESVQTIQVNHQLERIIEPKIPADQLKIVYKLFEKETLLKLIDEFHEIYKNNPIIPLKGVRYFTRYTTTRHGSCNKRLRRINFNTHLIHFPKQYVEYVFVHEIVHLLHPHHKKAFYDTVSKLMPHYKTIQNELKQYSKY